MRLARETLGNLEQFAELDPLPKLESLEFADLHGVYNQAVGSKILMLVCGLAHWPRVLI